MSGRTALARSDAFTLADLPHLATVLETYRPRLVYIDAIQAVLGGKVDANRANQLKELLDPLAKLAATYRCAILASLRRGLPAHVLDAIPEAPTYRVGMWARWGMRRRRHLVRGGETEAAGPRAR